MPNWKKVITSGSKAHLNEVTASGFKVNGDGDAQLEVEGSITSSNDISASGVISTTTLQNVSNINYGTGTYGDIDLGNGILQLRSTNNGSQGLKLYGGAAGAASPYIDTDTHTSLLVKVAGSNVGHFSSMGIKSYSNITASAVECNNITASGYISASGGVETGLLYSPTGTNLSVNGFGDLTLKASNGSVTLDSNTDIELNAGGGNVTFEDDSGGTKVNINTTSGHINADGIVSSSQDFRLGYKPDAGSYISASSDGTIEISGSGDVAILDVEGAITASAISSSGALFGSTFTNDSTVAGSSITGSVTGSFTGDGSNLNQVTAKYVTITDNENTNEDNALVFTSAGDVDGGNLGLESDGDLTYNPSTGTLTTTKIATTTITATTNKFAVTGNTDGTHQGDVVYIGSTSTNVGQIYHYKSDGTWELANADDVSTADGLLGVALGGNSSTDGMLLRGMVTLDHDPGAVGDVLYLESDNIGDPGDATATKPAASGDCVRVIGYCLDASNGQIWFNPDNTFVEVA